MNIESYISRMVCALTLLLATRTHLEAQGTAFSYQGRLTDNGSPANGDYELQFYLRDAFLGGNPVGTTNTRSVTGISNGFFAVTLDFGPNVFNGQDRWLEIGVRTNGSSDPFVPLSPRQAVTPSPYAIYSATANSASTAATASNVIANAVNGVAIQDGVIVAAKISSGQVVKSLNGLTDAVTLSAGSNVTLSPSGNTVQISASAGLVWQTPSSLAIQAQPNTGYLLTNATRQTLTLPVAPNPGDIVRVSSSGLNGWKIAQNNGQSVISSNLPAFLAQNWTAGASPQVWLSVASSADGTRLVAVGQNTPIYTSSDAGGTWTAHDTNRYWASVASSADGTKLVAAEGAFGLDGQIYTSTNSGVDWTASGPTNNWTGVASSADGVKLVAVGFGAQIYTSTNSGVTWTARATNQGWFCVASTPDGTRLVAAIKGGAISHSLDSGNTWLISNTPNNWQSLAISADGNKVFGVGYPGRIYKSNDGGVTWSPVGDAVDRYYRGIVCSSNASSVVAVAEGGQIYASSNEGQTYTAHELIRSWSSVAASSDASRLVATVQNGLIYTSILANGVSSSVGTAGYLLGDQYSSIELQYVGNGQFIPLSHIGTISAY